MQPERTVGGEPPLPEGPGRGRLQRSKFRAPGTPPEHRWRRTRAPRGSGDRSPPTVEKLRKNPTRFSVPLVLPSVSRWNTLGNPGETGAHRWRRTQPPRGSGERSPSTVNHTLGEPGATGAHRWRRTPPPQGSGERFAFNGVNRSHAWRTGCNWSAPLKANPTSPRVRGEVRLQRLKNLEKFSLDFSCPWYSV